MREGRESARLMLPKGGQHVRTSKLPRLPVLQFFLVASTNQFLSDLTDYAPRAPTLTHPLPSAYPLPTHLAELTKTSLG